jgi:sugar phosphate permease
VVAGAGTAFSFIPISVAALAGVAKHLAGLASGLLNTSTQLGGAIASSVATTHTDALLHAGHTPPVALTGGFQRAFWVLGVIALLAVPAILVLLRRSRQSEAPAQPAIGEPQPALAPAS